MDFIDKFRRHIKKKLLHHDLDAFETERTDLFNIVRRTIEYGESDSVLVIGPSGCGKTTVIRSIMSEIERKCNDYIVVELNGLLHTNDNLAFRDIARQLNVDNLSGENVVGSFADTLSFSLQSLQSVDKNVVKSVIFILEEFQYFCSHRNQTLLYNLFDVAQSQQAPICVVGLTTRIDITELLEKRVKSRFSDRKLYMYPKDNFEDRLTKLRSLLIEKDKVSFDKSFVRSWNKRIEELLTNREAIDLLKQVYRHSKSEKLLLNFMLVIISNLTEANAFPTLQDFQMAFNLLIKEDKVKVLQSLSILEFCLIIAMHHQSDIYDGEPFNFEIIYQRYAKFANRALNIPCVQRPVAMKAFETIIDFDLISPVGVSTTRTTAKEYVLYLLTVSNSEIQEAAKTYENLPSEIKRWSMDSLC